MRNSLQVVLFFLLIILIGNSVSAQENKQKHDFQIALPRPAKSIRLLMYEKNFIPIQGNLSEDKKSIIIKNYEQGSRVHVKVEYEDGTVEEFVKSPCYIDPVIS
jgi:hypothetical protein